jgi:glycosyltransferase involved in cell wall biosynthesis
MRILHVISSVAPAYGGPSKAVVEMCHELTRRGEDVEIYTTNVDGRHRLTVELERPYDVDGFRITYFPIQAVSAYKVSLPLARALRDSIPSFDVVHIHSLYQFPASAAAFYCRRYGVPYILRPHGTLDPFMYRHHRLRKWIYETVCERRNLAYAAAVQFTTEDEKLLAETVGLRFRGTVIPLGVTVERTTGPLASMAHRWPETAGKKVILFLGRINFKKGLDILCEAFAEIARQRDDVHLLLAGPDHEGFGKQVIRWLSRQRILHRVTFCGMLTGVAKETVLAEASLFVLPSYTENFGIAVVEAMAAGLPVVISNKVNIWREVEENGAGIVVAPESRATVEAMRMLLQDTQKAKRMGERGMVLAKQRFSWETAGAALVESYREIISSQRSPHHTTE